MVNFVEKYQMETKNIPLFFVFTLEFACLSYTCLKSFLSSLSLLLLLFFEGVEKLFNTPEQKNKQTNKHSGHLKYFKLLLIC